jgi:uncharacterized membrane protein HdeD (DUF308 family)
MSNEATVSVGTAAVTDVFRVAFGIAGALSVAFGVLILVAPLKTASIIAAIIAVYAIVSGAVYAIIGILSRSLTTVGRVGHVLLGVLFVVAGVVAFTDLGNATIFLAVFVAVVIGIVWIIEGVVALTTLGAASSRGWVVAFAVLSIIAGIAVVLSPLFAATVIWIYLGVSLVVLGIVQIIRAFTFGRSNAV